LDEDRSSVVFGSRESTPSPAGGTTGAGTRDSEFNLDQFLKPEYMVASPYMDIMVPSKVEFRIPAHKQESTCLAFNPLGDAIVTGGADTLVRLWSPATGKEIQTLRGHSKAITDVAISLDNELLAGASTEHKVLLWKLKTMRTQHTF
jgi:WD40 repeat protein